MGFVYAGGKTNQKTNGYLKIGETNQKYLSMRVGEIRAREGNFVVFKYLEIPNSSLSVTRAIEGHARMMLERDGYQQVQNDHFVVNMTPATKDAIYNEFVNRAIQHMTAYCDMMGIEYIVKEGKPTARKNHRKREKRA